MSRPINTGLWSSSVMHSLKIDEAIIPKTLREERSITTKTFILRRYSFIGDTFEPQKTITNN
jgi:hypothetical protein